MNLTEIPSNFNKGQVRSSSMSYVGSSTTLVKLDEMGDKLDKDNPKLSTEKKPRVLSKMLSDECASSTQIP
jgi:hypothetical protein